VSVSLVTYGISGSHSVTYHPTQVNAPTYNPSQRPVGDLPTPEGWKAESGRRLSWTWNVCKWHSALAWSVYFHCKNTMYANN